MKEVDIALSTKADLSVPNDYVTKEQPEFNLTGSDRLNEKKHPLEGIKINKTDKSSSSWFPVTWITETTKKMC